MFYQEALNLSGEYKKALLRISEFKEQSSQKLSIGTLPILSQYHLTAMLKDFADSHPQIHLMLEEVEEHDLLRGFSNNAYDFIITRSNMLDNKNHTFRIRLNHPLYHLVFYQRHIIDKFFHIAKTPFYFMGCAKWGSSFPIGS